MDAFETLQARGFIQQCTAPEAVQQALNEGTVTFYAGFDPTGDSLHVGHLLPVMAMSWLQRFGHRAIAVVGGGTAMVGDPSGKTEMRKMLSNDSIEHNKACLKNQLSYFLEVDGDKGMLVDNADWLLDLNYIDFLREIGRLFSVNRMLSAEAYKQRLEKGLSFIEFNYQILQAYDFLELNKRYDCTLQIGGDDQWGNIVAGTDLIRRKGGTQSHGLTQPLITTATGAKMGKTAAGAVWLDPNKLSPFDYFQYWYNVDDRDVIRFLKLFTFLSLEEIGELEKLEGAAIRDAKLVLAYETTKLAHGQEAADSAKEGRLAMLKGQATDDMPSFVVTAGVGLLEALADAGVTKSKGEARRMVQQGGVKINGEKVTDIEAVLSADLLAGEGVVVRLGKKRAVRFTA